MTGPQVGTVSILVCLRVSPTQLIGVSKAFNTWATLSSLLPKISLVTMYVRATLTARTRARTHLHTYTHTHTHTHTPAYKPESLIVLQKSFIT